MAGAVRSGASEVAPRVRVISSRALTAVVSNSAQVVRRTLLAPIAIPLVPTGAIAAGAGVTTHVSRVVGAVGDARTLQKAVRVHSLVRRRAPIAVIRFIVRGGASRAGAANPLVPACALTVRQQARDVRSVAGAILGVRANAETVRIPASIAGRALPAIGRSVVVAHIAGGTARTGPLVAARAVALRKGVSSDNVRVARAVGGCCTGQVALGVRVVRRLARTAVGRGIEGVGASVARVACVVVAACTLA